MPPLWKPANAPYPADLLYSQYEGLVRNLLVTWLWRGFVRHVGGLRLGWLGGFVCGPGLVALVLGMPAFAETYKYQDEHGR